MAAQDDRAPPVPVATHRLEALLAEARGALERAYAPYSNFPVAAAVLDEQGRVHLGVNVENVSYGLTMCAERVAVGVALAAGARRLHAVAVTSRRLHPISPCGACRQVLIEFADAAVPVASDDAQGRMVVRPLGELLPGAFARLDPDA